MKENSENEWRKKTLAYQFFGIGKPKNKQTEVEKKKYFNATMSNGPFGVWVRIFGLGPIAARVILGLGAFAFLYFVCVPYLLSKF